MPCYKPLMAWRTDLGSVTFSYQPQGEGMQLPCGKCIGCRIDKSREWAIRCQHEIQHQESLGKKCCFITLTYKDLHDQDGNWSPSLDYKDFQKFMKRLRHETGKISFYMCGEYGKDQDDLKLFKKGKIEENQIQLGRKHFHAIIFGWDTPEKEKQWIHQNKHKQDLYNSKIIQSLWPHGFNTTAAATWNSSAYVSRYLLKKIYGNISKEHYAIVNRKTGERQDVKPEFTRMSLKPAIGKQWLQKHYKDIYPSDTVILRTMSGIKKFKVPKYYDQWMEENHPETLERVKEQRRKQCKLHAKDNTWRRLKDREHIHYRSIKNLHRKLDYEISSIRHI